jgi:Pyruvate/2-oxoacid:ferredoxin oxidoreductase delta subunit
LYSFPEFCKLPCLIGSFLLTDLVKGLDMSAKVDKSVCTGCGACVDSCPSEAIEMQDNKANIDANSCVDCGVCVDECPLEAISME